MRVGVPWRKAATIYTFSYLCDRTDEHVLCFTSPHPPILTLFCRVRVCPDIRVATRWCFRAIRSAELSTRAVSWQERWIRTSRTCKYALTRVCRRLGSWSCENLLVFYTDVIEESITLTFAVCPIPQRYVPHIGCIHRFKAVAFKFQIAYMMLPCC